MSKTILIHSFFRLVHVLIVFGTIKAMTLFLPKAELGALFILQALGGGVSGALQTPLIEFAKRHFIQWRNQSLLLQATGKLNLDLVLMAVAGLLVTLIIQVLFHPGSFETWQLVLLVAFFLLSLGIYNLFLEAFNLLNHQGIYFTMVLGSAGFTLVLALIFAKVLFQPIAEVWFCGAIAGNLIAGFFGYFCLKKKYPTKNSQPLHMNSRQLLSFCAPLVIANIFAWILIQGYRFPLERLEGLETLGIIGLGLAIASSLTAYFQYLINQLAFPHFYSATASEIQTDRLRAWKSTFQFYFFSALLFATFLSTMADSLIQLFANADFKEAALYLAAGAWIEFFRLIAVGVNLINFSEKTTMKTNYAYGVGVLIFILTIIVGIPFYRTEYVLPTAMLLGQTASLLCLVASNLKHIHGLSLTHLARAGWLPALICIIYYLGQTFFPPEGLWSSIAMLFIYGVLLLVGFSHAYSRLKNTIPLTN